MEFAIPEFPFLRIERLLRHQNPGNFLLQKPKMSLIPKMLLLTQLWLMEMVSS